MKKTFGLAVLLFGAILAGCQKQTEAQSAQPKAVTTLAGEPTQAQPRLQTLKLWIGAEELTAELALTFQQQRTGMMFRTNMLENEGMLFVWPVPHRASFWMKNTPLPLSAAYIDPDGVILELNDFQPHNTNSVEAVSDRVQYVLETTQGWFKRHRINVGTVVKTDRGSLRETFIRK